MSAWADIYIGYNEELILLALLLLVQAAYHITRNIVDGVPVIDEAWLIGKDIGITLVLVVFLQVFLYHCLHLLALP